MSIVTKPRSRGKGKSNGNDKPAEDTRELDMRAPPGRKGHRKPRERTRYFVEQWRPEDCYPLPKDPAVAGQDQPVQKSLLETAKEARRQKAISKAKVEAKGKAKPKSTKLARVDAGDDRVAPKPKTSPKAKSESRPKDEDEDEDKDDKLVPTTDEDWDEALDKFGEGPAARTCMEDTKRLKEERAVVSEMLSDSAREGGGPRLFGPLVPITNNLHQAYMLAQILYFFGDSSNDGHIRARIFTRDGLRWLAKFASDWVAELWLTNPRQARHIRDGLKTLELIEIRRSKFDGRVCTFIRPNYERIAEAILEAIQDRNKKENRDARDRKDCCTIPGPQREHARGENR